MLMHKAARSVSSPDWTYEPKWDGFRVIATVRDGGVRAPLPRRALLHEAVRTREGLAPGFPMSIVLDGEVIAVNEEGWPNFEELQQRLRPRDGKLPAISATWRSTTCT
jgi:bifunctional non-homologous end joining protein LigD